MLGYFFLFLSGLLWAAFVRFNASSSPANLGYVWLAVFSLLGFVAASLVLTILVLVQGGFGWVGPGTGLRVPAVLLAWLGVVVATGCCAWFKWDHRTNTSYPGFVDGLAEYGGQWWIPLLWLVACFLALDPGRASGLPVGVARLPFWLALGLGTVYGVGLLTGYVRGSVRASRVEAIRYADEAYRNHQRTLKFIEKQGKGCPLLDLLVYTGRYHEEDVRQAALARIKARPDWEAQLLGLLQNRKTAYQVYTFLDGNRLDHPERLAAPLNESIARLAETIRAYIEESNNLQRWTFDHYNIDRMLRAINEQFADLGVDFYPNVLKLQQALNTPPPARFKGVRFDARHAVASWLKRHRK